MHFTVLQVVLNVTWWHHHSRSNWLMRAALGSMWPVVLGWEVFFPGTASWELSVRRGGQAVVKMLTSVKVHLKSLSGGQCSGWTPPPCFLIGSFLLLHSIAMETSLDVTHLQTPDWFPGPDLCLDPSCPWVLCLLMNFTFTSCSLAQPETLQHNPNTESAARQTSSCETHDVTWFSTNTVTTDPGSFHLCVCVCALQRSCSYKMTVMMLNFIHWNDRNHFDWHIGINNVLTNNT